MLLFIILNKKKRIEELEKENRDLNDYILLVNKNLEKQEAVLNAKSNESNNQHSIEQEEIIDRQLKKINSLNEQIENFERERESFIEQLNKLKTQSVATLSTTNNESSDENTRLVNKIDENLATNFKLLEDKFNKVMIKNADLNDKNQQLEHVVMQLQCETETIGFYFF